MRCIIVLVNIFGVVINYSMNDQYDTKKFLIRNEEKKDLIFPTVFRIEDKAVIEYIVIGETEDNLVIAPNCSQMMVKKSLLYDNKKDAQYYI